MSIIIGRSISLLSEMNYEFIFNRDAIQMLHCRWKPIKIYALKVIFHQKQFLITFFVVDISINTN